MTYPERRKFVKTTTKALSGLATLSFFDASAMSSVPGALLSQPDTPPEILARDESYWGEIQKAYRVSSKFINLENGYYSLMAEPVTNAQIDDLKMINANHSFYMRRHYKEDRARILD